MNPTLALTTLFLATAPASACGCTTGEAGVSLLALIAVICFRQVRRVSSGR